MQLVNSVRSHTRLNTQRLVHLSKGIRTLISFVNLRSIQVVMLSEESLIKTQKNII